MIWRTPSDPEETLQPKRLAGWPGTLEVTVLCLNPGFNPSSGVLSAVTSSNKRPDV